MPVNWHAQTQIGCNRRTSELTKKCTGVAGRAESEINVTGGNPVILGVILSSGPDRCGISVTSPAARVAA